MPSWFTDSVRYKVLAAALAGAAAVVIAYSVERWVRDDAYAAAFRAGLDAVVVIVVGIVVTGVLDRRSTERAAQAQRRRRAAGRVLALSRYGSDLNLAAWGWVSRPERDEQDPWGGGDGSDRPGPDDRSVSAGVDLLKGMARELGDETRLNLGAVEKELKELHEGSPELLLLWLQGVHRLGTLYWFEGGRVSRLQHLAGLRNALQGEFGDANDSLRTPFTAFARALAHTEAAKLKTDAVVQERLVVASVGEPLGSSAMAREQPDVVRLLGSVSETGPSDSVLHLTIVADVLARRAVELMHDLPEAWETAVHGTLNRCVGALEGEVAHVQVLLLRLVDLIEALVADVESTR